METQEQKEEQLIKDYNSLKPKLIEWANFVDLTLQNIIYTNIESASIKIQIPPQYRLKSDESLIGKAFYNNQFKNSSKPLKRIEDKVGTRIVLTSLREVKIVKEIVLSNTEFWNVRISRDPDKSFDKKPKEFDYTAIHLNLTPLGSSSIFKGFSNTDLEFYVCELQIRTLLQHAFAEVAHDTIYKGAFSSNNQLVRLLSKAEALMEVTDEYFCNAYETMEKVEEYEKSFLNGLIKLAESELDFKFDKNSIDIPLTNDIFNIFEIRNIEIREIEKNIQRNKSLLKSLLANTKSYLGRQPIVILIAYLVFFDSSELKEKWHLEENILKEIFMRLNFSFGIG
ncbi:RelA/SpoT domain-containing protein [Arcicella sp. LKC2W]|uniref:GTP pyrophosphokinase n=1 Tax=Arcicella sp. LKC2W TaxID=2984198 RepID=UPI002B20C7B9|nr:RelA/SpoT domain-containing protein [Arcicella sp. LKC2W]MEA5460605.1 RelA/SpoT domain-containing protein [Arcicella sp. LKC2W]